MARLAIDFYSGYLEEVLNTVGSRDVTLVERYQRLGEHTQMVLGLPDHLMVGWKEAIEQLLMDPPREIRTVQQAVALASLMCDAGQRRFRLEVDSPEVPFLWEIFDHLGKREWAGALIDSAVSGLRSPTSQMRWGFLDVSQVEALLIELFGDESFKTPRTAAIAGRLSTHARGDAERELLEVGIETQNSVSHNIDYLIIGSKGTGGTKHDKVRGLQDRGHSITVLDEEGFERLIRSPKPPRESWTAPQKDFFERFVSALRHVWAFELDLYALVYETDLSVPML